MNKDTIHKKIYILSFVLFFASCASLNNNLSSENETAIQSELRNIAVENLRSWEPPFYEEKFLNDFSQSKDLLVVIDKFVIKGFEKWKNIAVESMQEEREQGYKMYKHNIDDINVSVLSKNSGVVTIIYTWDYITKKNLHFNVKATAVLVFKKVNENWKIINLIVSHGDKEQIKS